MDEKLRILMYPTFSTAPNNATNLTKLQMPVRNETIARVEIAFLANILVLAVVGNGCVISALIYRKVKTTRMHMLILHLCIADLSVAFLNVLPQLIEEITFVHLGNDVTCKLRMYLSVVVLYASTNILLATAIDRFRSICYPLTNVLSSTKQMYLMIGLAWMLSLLLPIPQLFNFRMAPWEGTPHVSCVLKVPLWQFRTYLIYFCITIYVGPLLLLTVLYGKISFVVWKNYHKRRTNEPECNGVTYRFQSGDSTGSNILSTSNNSRTYSTRVLSRVKVQTFKLTFVVIVAYALCWAPFIITQLWWEFAPNAPLNDMVFVVSLLMASLNSCCNPFIYLAFSGSLIKRILPCCKQMCGPERDKHCIPHVKRVDNIMERQFRNIQNANSPGKEPCIEMLVQNYEQHSNLKPSPGRNLKDAHGNKLYQGSRQTAYDKIKDPLYGHVMIDRRKCLSQPKLEFCQENKSSSRSKKSSSSGTKGRKRGFYITGV